MPRLGSHRFQVRRRNTRQTCGLPCARLMPHGSPLRRRSPRLLSAAFVILPSGGIWRLLRAYGGAYRGDERARAACRDRRRCSRQGAARAATFSGRAAVAADCDALGVAFAGIAAFFRPRRRAARCSCTARCFSPRSRSGPALLRLHGTERWHGVLGLLVTGKLSCLLAALLVFAPRPLYPHRPSRSAMSLADQQLAGLLMLTACPLSYVVAGIVMTVAIGRGTCRRAAIAHVRPI